MVSLTGLILDLVLIFVLVIQLGDDEISDSPATSGNS